MTGLVARAEVEIAAPPGAVWKALTDPDCIRQYFLGSVVETDWQPGSPITWSGEYNGTSYQDKGEILEVQQDHLLVLTHFSPTSGQPDRPENYHRLSYRLEERAGRTLLTLTQDNNSSDLEVEHSTSTWQSTLDSLKGLVESSSP